ncbi:hypothetical protein ACFQY5_38515 [Paeniroseomonas aquatica]|uniref:hypothetical protein n=1 Tax=Paeniroseomonas aquatica TaxID=373043 RepID=UPI00362270F4
MPLVAVFGLHPHDGVARLCLSRRIRVAYERGVPAQGWKTVAKARQRFGDGSLGFMP